MFSDGPERVLDAGAFADTYNFRRAEIIEDGSLAVTMAKTMYNQMREEAADGESLKMDAIVGSERTPFIRSIGKGKDFRSITIDVDAEGYRGYDGPLAFEVGVLALLYQTVAGLDPGTEVTVRDVQTKQPMDSIQVSFD